VARVRREVAGLDALGVRFDRVLASPLVRTRQTADLFARVLGRSSDVILIDALSPGGTPTAVIGSLGEQVRQGSIGVVGHEPDLGRLAARLIGTKAAVPFKKGAVCRIDLDTLPPAHPGRLVWFATPKMLRRIRRR
jgi:phosphohistidine phosphatase